MLKNVIEDSIISNRLKFYEKCAHLSCNNIIFSKIKELKELFDSIYLPPQYKEKR